MSYFIHHLADVQSKAIVDHTKVWQFVVILPDARIGMEANICSQVLIENNVIIGDSVTVKSGVQLWDGLRIEDDVFIGPNVTFTNDPFPRSKHYPTVFAVTTVKAGASIGGGGDHPARHNDRPRRHGWRCCGGDEVGTRPRGGRRQPGARRALSRGPR